MTNWGEQGVLFEEFTEELTYEWMKKGFDREECREWLNVGMKATDAGFCAWLRGGVKTDAQQTLNYGDEESLRKQYEEHVRYWRLSEEVIKQLKDFKHRQLTPEQKSLISKLISNEELRRRYQNYGLCAGCQQPNINWKSCQFCKSKHFQKDFKNWTSGNLEIDEFIQRSQLQTTKSEEILEWIPHEKFSSVEYLSEGGFGKVYKAKLIDGYIKGWDAKNDKWERDKDAREVVLKSLHNSQNIATDFLQEIFNHKLVGGFVVKCYGVSQDPQTRDFFMVMEYIKHGNLRQYLQNNRENFKGKLYQLLYIASGLESIHHQGLVHRDFHTGNILRDINYCHITDLGLCRPANETDKEGKVYGVLPYVAPEVLRGKEYTLTADIYSFGMVIYEYVSGLPPYTVYDQELKNYKEIPHDISLILKICEGLRPNLDTFKAPQLLKDLIKKCWDADPLNRPVASELRRTLNNWLSETHNRKNTEFYQQYKKIEKAEDEEFQEFCHQNNYEYKEDMFYRKKSKAWEAFCKSPSVLYKTHPQAIYTSRLLPTKEITQLLQRKVNEAFFGSKNICLDINDFNLDKLNIQETQEEISAKTEQEQISAHEAQIEVLPKQN